MRRVEIVEPRDALLHLAASPAGKNAALTVTDDTSTAAVLDTQKREISHLRRELERARVQLSALAAERDAHTGWQLERDDLLKNLEVQLVERDEELHRAWAESEWRKHTETSLSEEVEWLRERERELRRQIDTMQQTRLWRIGASYWRFKDMFGTIRRRR